MLGNLCWASVQLGFPSLSRTAKTSLGTGTMTSSMTFDWAGSLVMSIWAGGSASEEERPIARRRRMDGSIENLGRSNESVLNQPT